MHARRFERVEVFDIEAAIPRAAGDDDRARRSPLADVKLQVEASVIARPAKRTHLVRNRHLGTEFLRLVVGARHQCHAGYSGGKAEIVFNPRRRARLAAERAAVEHKHGQPFRRGIDGRCEAGGPGTYDRHVVDPVRIDRPDQSDAARQLVLAGIAQQLSARTEHDRQFAGIDMETLDQGFGAAICFGIEQLMRVSRCGGESRAAEARRRYRHGRR